MIKCDFCEKSAVRNYQKIWVSWVLVGKGYSESPRVEEQRREITVPKDPDNIHVCADHEKEWLDNNIKL